MMFICLHLPNSNAVCLKLWTYEREDKLCFEVEGSIYFKVDFVRLEGAWSISLFSAGAIALRMMCRSITVLCITVLQAIWLVENRRKHNYYNWNPNPAPDAPPKYHNLGAV